MKTVSAATLALLATGQYVKWDLYKFTLPGGAVLFAHDADYNVTVGGQLYSGGLIFKRGSFHQTCDMSVQTVTLDVSPQFDYPGGPPTVGGFPFLAAGRQGLLDAATVRWSKLFLPIPTPANYLNWPDTVTYGAVPWFTGVVTDVRVGRQTANLSVNSNHELLNVQMPRNLVQSGCSHMLFDAGCALLKSAFRVSGAMTGAPGVLSFNTNLGAVNGYFDLGVLTMTSGVNNGVSRTVRSYLNASGNLKVLMPFNTAPANGDTFTILPGCDKLQATCSAKFNNLIHFRGLPYVPVPETQYEGGANAPQGGNLKPPGPGSGPGSGGRYTYVP